MWLESKWTLYLELWTICFLCYCFKKSVFAPSFLLNILRHMLFGQGLVCNYFGDTSMKVVEAWVALSKIFHFVVKHCTWLHLSMFNKFYCTGVRKIGGLNIKLLVYVKCLDTKLLEKYNNFWNCTGLLKNLLIFTPLLNGKWVKDFSFVFRECRKQSKENMWWPCYTLNRALGALNE